MSNDIELRQIFKSKGYELGEFVGKGTYTRMYNVTDNVGGVYIAKIFNIQRIQNDLGVANPQEILVVGFDLHKKLWDIEEMVKYKDHLANEKITALIMEKVNGQSLKNVIERNGTTGISEELVCMILKSIVSCINGLHDREIIHRDLRPENIYLLNDDRSIKIGDLGFTYSNSKHPPSINKVASSIDYLPPEVLNNKDYCSKLNDIWAIGLIAIDLTIGRNKISKNDLLQSYNNGMIEIGFEGSFYSKLLPTFICSCMNIDIKKRITIDKLLKHELFYKYLSSNRYNIVNKLVNSSTKFESIYNDKVYNKIIDCTNNEDIKTLDLCWINLSEKSNEYMDSLSDLLGTQDQLLAIHLGWCFMGSKGMKYISRCFRNLDNLSDINLFDNNLCEVGIKDLSAQFRYLKNLTVLNLGNNNISDNCMREFSSGLKNLNKLTSLILSGNKISPVGMRELCPSLQTLIKLESVDLSKNHVQDEGAKELSLVFVNISKLSNLNLDDNDISDSGLKEIGNTIRYISSLETIILNNNNISDFGIKDFSNSMKYLKNLSTFNLSFNRITDSTIKFIGSSLPSSEQSLSMELYNIKVKDEAIIKSAKKLYPNLTITY